MASARRLLRAYWPLVAVPFVAVSLDGILVWRGQAWSLSDWMANVVLGAVVTVTVGVLLARRQASLQEALADLELIEKVAVLSGRVSYLRTSSQPGEIVRALYDARAGMSLVPLARGPMQAEYLQTVVAVIGHVENRLVSSLEAYADWTADDWEQFRRVVLSLGESTRAGARTSSTVRTHWTDSIDPATRRLAVLAASSVPFDAFRNHYTDGPDRIRVALDWDRLAGLTRAVGASVRIERIHTRIAPYDLAALAHFHAPWYADPGCPAGREVGHDHPSAHPIRHTQVVDRAAVVDTDRSARITSLRSWYSTQANNGEIGLTLATCAADRDHVLVLDGNHRLVALAGLVKEGCPATLREFRVTGLADAVPPLVPDLAHYPAATS
ncbi:hypothetical protein [Streptomyces sp. SID3343]|uniref:hypothetical protein n=1 Tax=Streptomyces sp. SID3343 TaxID=2690260 RepID=UPI00136ABAF2|nr:hypothetical protein [Streptomyces sp. SID3343]MYV97429.1 hypothetical protein [Streptomyces sp. SID3343]